MRTLVAALVALSSAPSLAQGAVPHAVPFGSVGNAIELVADVPEGATAAVVEGPAWVVFEALSAAALADAAGSGDRVARFAFGVAHDAPVGAAAAVTFEVRHGSEVLARHPVSLVVEPPAALALDAPLPNPARTAVAVPFTLPVEGSVRVSVYDALGREVAVLVDEAMRAGGHTAHLDAASLAPGAYLVRLHTAGAPPRTRALTVVR